MYSEYLDRSIHIRPKKKPLFKLFEYLVLVMSSLPSRSKASSRSAHPIRETSSLKCKISPITLGHKTGSEPGRHVASSSYDPLGSAESCGNGRTKLSFPMQRWLSDTEGDRLMANLTIASTFPDYEAALGPDDLPALSIDRLSDSNGTHRSCEAPPGGNGYAHWGTSLRYIGAWCNEKESRFASLESFTVLG